MGTALHCDTCLRRSRFEVTQNCRLPAPIAPVPPPPILGWSNVVNGYFLQRQSTKKCQGTARPITPVPSAPPILLALLLPTSDPKNTRDKCPQTKGSPAAGLFRCTCTEEKPMPYAAAATTKPADRLSPNRPGQCCRVCKPSHEPENRALTACTPPGKTNSAPETKLSEATDSPPGEAFNSRKRRD